MTVYLLWLHDSVLGVYASLEAAEHACEAYRAENQGDWRQTVSGRWWCEAGDGVRRVSRLQVEPREVLGR